MNHPLSIIRGGLVEIAADLTRVPDALGRAIFDIDDIVKRRDRERSAASLDDAIVDQMVRVPWRITRAVYGVSVPAMWPHQGKTASDVLADCRANIANEIGRARHWTYDANRLIALRQAEKALARLGGRM